MKTKKRPEKITVEQAFGLHPNKDSEQDPWKAHMAAIGAIERGIRYDTRPVRMKPDVPPIRDREHAEKHRKRKAARASRKRNRARRS